MSEGGKKILRGAREALAYARGQEDGFLAHVPAEGGVNEHSVGTWDQFVSEMQRLKELRDRVASEQPTYVSDLLFRGQADARWRLTTTLERHVGSHIDAAEYYRRIFAAKPRVETFTGKTWDIRTPPDYRDWLQEADLFGRAEFPGYEYMIYLRHHGFPSPLLDWTRSPFIAAYFAFANVLSEAKEVAVFAYLEDSGGGKSFVGGEPFISSRGPHVRSHQRHFLQQCEYTVCLSRDRDTETYYYECHEDVFAHARQDQDRLWKVNIPASERQKALTYLDSVNLNAFSLFGSVEGLMETEAIREFHLNG